MGTDWSFYWPVLWDYRHLLVDGFITTLYIFFISTVLSVFFGMILGFMKSSKNVPLRYFAVIYTEINRNTPLVVKLFFLYFGLGMDAYSAAVVGLAINQSAYMADVFQSCIEAVPSGQVEAAQSGGLSSYQISRYVVLPQAIRICIPPMTSQVLEVLKNSSVVMALAVPELMFQTQQIEVLSYRGFEAATAGTVLYLSAGLVISWIASLVERLVRPAASEA